MTISVSQTRGACYVDFIDNGSGIAPENEQLIFEKFSRVSDQSKAGGAGLGLAICREIMNRLGGDVDYIRRPAGHAFRVTLPKAMMAVVLAET